MMTSSLHCTNRPGGWYCVTSCHGPYCHQHDRIHEAVSQLLPQSDAHGTCCPVQALVLEKDKALEEVVAEATRLEAALQQVRHS